MMKFFKLKEYYKYKHNEYGIDLSTGFEEDSDSNSLNIKFMKYSFWFRIPQIIKPKRVWVDLSQYNLATEHNGKKGYWKNIRREYGIMTFDGSLHIHYGIQPGSWSRDDPKNSDHTKVWFIPWLNKRYIRTSYYDVVNQSHLKTYLANERANYFEDEFKFKESIRKMNIKFNDFDGEEITAKAFIEEREWRHGLGLFKWLTWFIKPTIQRNLWIDFDKEVGYEKGSWKGGVMGQGIDMMVGESAQSAFLRYANGTGRYKYRGEQPRNFTNVEFSYES